MPLSGDELDLYAAVVVVVYGNLCLTRRIKAALFYYLLMNDFVSYTYTTGGLGCRS